MKFAVRIVIAKDTMPASEAIDHETVSHLMTLSHDELWRTMPSSFSRPADWRTQVGGMPSTKKIGDVLMSMRFPNMVSKDTFESSRQLRKPPSNP